MLPLLLPLAAAVPAGYNETYSYPDGIGGLIIEGPFPYKNGPSTWSDDNLWGAYGLLTAPGTAKDGKCSPIPEDSRFAKSALTPVPLTNGIKDCLMGCNLTHVKVTGTDPCKIASFDDPVHVTSSCFDVGPGFAGGHGVCGYNCTAFHSQTEAGKLIPCTKEDIGKGACNIFCDPRTFPTASPSNHQTKTAHVRATAIAITGTELVGLGDASTIASADRVKSVAVAPISSGRDAKVNGESNADVLFAFTGGNHTGWQTWDWDAMTHLGFWSHPEPAMIAKARQHGVKLFHSCTTGDKADWVDADKRSALSKACADDVRSNSFDGAFFDFEGNGLSAAQREGYTKLAEETTAALRPLNATLMVCVGGRPTYELRNYDYAGLAAAVDFLFIMMYDMHFWDDYTCVKTSQGNVCSPAEASIREVKAGVVEYVADVPASKLVLGLPWYGQRYVQIGLPINYGQIDYKDVLEAIDAGRMTKKVHDDASNSWKITCSTDCLPGKKGTTVWYDDATTLAPKFRIAGEHGLRGVGMWKVDDLPVPGKDGSDPHASERQAMWAAIKGWRDTPAPRETHAITAPISATLLQSTQHVVNASSSKPDRLTPHSIVFNGGAHAGPTVVVSTADERQPIAGFGGAITDAVAHVWDSMNDELKKEAIEALWGPSGNKYNMARLTIGATDFSTTVYNYNENKGDLQQTKFSIDHDKAQIIPLAQRAMHSALAAGHSLEFLSSPWSPPSWMKRGWLTLKGYMRNSAKPGMIDDKKIFESYALYTSKYLTEYKKAGINVSRITIQNEPDSADHMVAATYPACNFNGTGEGSFLRDYLGPRIRADHPGVQIYVHDGQKFHDVPIRTRVEEILAAAGSTNGNGSYVDGVAFHWYGMNLHNYQYLADLARSHPELKLLGTEATLQDPRTQKDTWKFAQMYAIDIIGDLNNGAEGWIEWNVLLDTTGGPTCIGPTQTSFCTPEIGHCDSPLQYDAKNGKLVYRDVYHIMAHISRYIRRNSRVVKTEVRPAATSASDANDASDDDALKAVAVLDPDGENKLVVVVVNPSATTSVDYNLDIGGGNVAAIKAPARSIQTIVVPSLP